MLMILSLSGLIEMHVAECQGAYHIYLFGVSGEIAEKCKSLVARVCGFSLLVGL